MYLEIEGYTGILETYLREDKAMDEKELQQFVEELEGFCGELCFRRTYEREGFPEGFGVTYTAVPTEDGDVSVVSPDGIAPDPKTEMLVRELFAESIWGRSHGGLGTVHKVKYEECERTMLVDPRHLPEGLQESVHRNLTGSSTEACPACDGTGTKDPSKWVTVQIPKQ